MPNHIIGIDPLSKAIETAKDRMSDRDNLTFEVAAVPWRTDKRFGFVISIDSMPENLAAREKYLEGVSNVLCDGGIALIISKHWIDTKIKTLRQQLASAKLGFGFADVVGGYGDFPTQFSVEGCLVLVKGMPMKAPNSLILDMNSNWNLFRDYANFPTTLDWQKTQAFKRALNPATGN